MDIENEFSYSRSTLFSNNVLVSSLLKEEDSVCPLNLYLCSSKSYIEGHKFVGEGKVGKNR